jgi:hypothetical protein
MTAKTAKLISRYASRTNQKEKAVKREWKGLPRTAKAERRRAMKAATQ